MRLIDADAIQWTANGCGHPNCKDICEHTKDDGTCCGWLVVNKRDIDKMPTIDATQVVRCEDCVHHENAYVKGMKISETEKYCLIFEDRVKNSHFCGYGERKER